MEGQVVPGLNKRLNCQKSPEERGCTGIGCYLLRGWLPVCCAFSRHGLFRCMPIMCQRRLNCQKSPEGRGVHDHDKKGATKTARLLIHTAVSSYKPSSYSTKKEYSVLSHESSVQLKSIAPHQYFAVSIHYMCFATVVVYYSGLQ
jgi:hypothetical protein